MKNQIERDIGEVMRDEMVIRDRIAVFLKDKPRTIPEIAEAVGHPGHEVLFWVMAMWKYGILRETGQPNEYGYYQYQLNR